MYLFENFTKKILNYGDINYYNKKCPEKVQLKS